MKWLVREAVKLTLLFYPWKPELQLNPNGKYLNLLLKNLQNVLVPELQTSSAKETASVMTNVLQELIKREYSTRELLVSSLEEGSAVLRRLDNAIGSVPAGQYRATDANTSELLEQHAVLTSRIQQRCEAILRRDVDKDGLLLAAAQWELKFYLVNASAPYEMGSPRRDFDFNPLHQESLQRFINTLPGSEQTEITRFEAISSGFGKQTYLCDTRESDGTMREFIVRKTDPVPIMEHGASRLENESALLKALASVDYPAPKPLAFASNWEDVDGEFYFVERSPGAVPSAFIDGAKQPVSESLLLEMAALMAKLHTLPMDIFKSYARTYESPALLSDSVTECYRHHIGGWQGYFAAHEHLESPFLVWLFYWLQNNIPESSEPAVLVHGDFNIHNLLIHDDKVSVVLDWECAGFGAPEQDLAYIKPHISEHIEWDKFVAHYVDCGGKQPNSDWMQYGMVYAALRANLAGNRGTLNLQRGTSQDIKYAMIELGLTPSSMKSALESAAPDAMQKMLERIQADQ